MINLHVSVDDGRSWYRVESREFEMSVERKNATYFFTFHQDKRNTIGGADAKIVRELWDTEKGIISIQVLHEFYVIVTQKIPSPLSATKARGIIISD